MANKKITQKEFLERVKQVHGNKYDYSKVEYVNIDTKVCIICPEHGEFWQTPYNHLLGKGCNKCKGGVKYTTDYFIEKSKQVHGDKYDYSKVEYVNITTKVCIICPEHGEFWQTPNNHLRGCGCRKCHIENSIPHNKSNVEEFIEKARKVHGDKYDYSKVEYVGKENKVEIICPIHNSFMITPHNHLRGQGCRLCGIDRRTFKIKDTLEDFIEKAKKVHGDKYDYSKVEYVNSAENVCIICPKHGEFWQAPNSHLSNHGCPMCAKEKRSNIFSMGIEKFIKRANIVHINKYDYSKVEYVNTDTKVCIICPEHGEFWQTPYTHLNGCGCPKCKSSSLENEIRCFLTSRNIKFVEQEHFSWLKNIKNMSIDFYLPNHKIAIECQGGQHFKPNDFFGGIVEFNKTINRDEKKYKKCLEHNVDILYYTKERIPDNFIGKYKYYDDLEELYDVIKSKEVI